MDDGLPVKWHIIEDPPLTGEENMQRDLRYFQAVSQGQSPPVLRLYSWNPPALSLGRLQKEENVVDLEACQRLGIDVVRRPTGGRAVLHDRELTYSIMVPEGFGPIPRGVLDSYRFFSQGIADAFALLGIEAVLSPRSRHRERGPFGAPGSCFDTPSPYELMVKGKKVVGSAQFRAGGALLQHGSIPLKFPYELYGQVLKTGMGRTKLDDYISSLAEQAAGLEDLGFQVTSDDLTAVMVRSFSRLMWLEG